jgi:predicted  nucleic acid-binding Zn-ribbon protein
MGTARDLITSSMVDSLLPYLERALEDVIYEVLDRRRVPTQSDFESLQKRTRQLESELAQLRKRIGELERQQGSAG